MTTEIVVPLPPLYLVYAWMQLAAGLMVLGAIGSVVSALYHFAVATSPVCRDIDPKAYIRAGIRYLVLAALLAFLCVTTVSNMHNEIEPRATAQQQQQTAP